MQQQILATLFNDFSSIKYVFIQSGDKYCKANGEQQYIDNCFLIGRDQIHIGIYANKDLMLMGILHQLGHVVQQNKKYENIYTYQKQAWTEAYTLAQKYSINITEEMKQYEEYCLNAYLVEAQ